MDEFTNKIRDAKSSADELTDIAPGLTKRATFYDAYDKTIELIRSVRAALPVPLPAELGPEERALRDSIMEVLRLMDGQLVTALDHPPMVEQDRAFPEMIDTLRKKLEELILKSSEVEGGRRRRNRKTRRRHRKTRRTRRHR